MVKIRVKQKVLVVVIKMQSLGITGLEKKLNDAFLMKGSTNFITESV